MGKEKNSRQSPSEPTEDKKNEIPAKLPPKKEEFNVEKFMEKHGRDAKQSPGGKIVSIARTETFEILLPSRGIPYQTEKYHYAFPEGRVVLAPMRGVEEEILYNPTTDFAENLNKVLDLCIVSKEIPPLDITASDRMAILIALRTHSLGTAKYTIDSKCRHCREQFKQQVDLIVDLNVRELDGFDGVKEEPYEMTLPMSKKKIAFRLMRGCDEIDIVKFAKASKKRNKEKRDPSENYRLAITLVEIEGNAIEDIGEKLKFMRTLSSGDINAYRLAIEDVGGYIDLTVRLECTHCGSENETIMPIDLEFFRPTR